MDEHVDSVRLVRDQAGLGPGSSEYFKWAEETIKDLRASDKGHGTKAAALSL